MPPLAHPDAPFEMSVQNLVYTAVLGTSVRLPHVALALAKCGAELNQKRFSAVILRTYLNARTGNAADVMLQQLEPVQLVRPRLDKIAVLIFRNGNLVCTGAKTFAQAQYMLLKTAQMLRDIGYEDASIVRMNIRNMVGRAQLPCRINRERMARELSAYVTYDPEHFPGAVVRHPLTWPITLLVFDSGRVVVTGTKSKARADAVLSRIKPLLMHFSIDTPEGAPMPAMPNVGNAVDTALYDLLGVGASATAKEIRKAFHAKAKELHPDKNPKLRAGGKRYEATMRRYRRVDAAYRVLSDIKTRERYDLTGEWDDVVVEDATDVEGEGQSDIDSDAEEEAEEAVKAAMGEHEDEDDVDAALKEFLRDIRE
jgi:transcription initiation factor TFIID TATA-box-binding protein